MKCLPNRNKHGIAQNERKKNTNNSLNGKVNNCDTKRLIGIISATRNRVYKVKSDVIRYAWLWTLTAYTRRLESCDRVIMWLHGIKQFFAYFCRWSAVFFFSKISLFTLFSVIRLSFSTVFFHNCALFSRTTNS